jgi:DNA anti-recombination protein RmuC
MVVDERARFELRERLKEHTDVETANLVIDQLPPIGEELATKSDIAALRMANESEVERLAAQIAQLRGELTGSIAELQASLSGKIAETGEKIAEQGAGLSAAIAENTAAIAGVEARTADRITRLQAQQTRLLGTLIAAMFGAVAVLVVGLVVPLVTLS